MKRLTTLAWLVLPTLCFAGDGFLGTKASHASGFDTGSSSPVSGGAVVQLLVALAIVLLLVRYVLPKAITKVGRKLNTNVTGGIRIEESASFAGGNLYVVQARSKTLLLSVTGTSVVCLSDLTETVPHHTEPKTFDEMLEASPGTHAPEPVELTETSDPFAETLARLDRLDRLTQS